MTVRFLPPLFVAAMLSAGGSFVFAETQILEEITIRARDTAPREESLTIREVRESAARDMGEALELVPGITSVRKGAIASDVVLRGLQRDNINVLLDGVRLHGGCPSRMDPPSFHFDFAEVESIEIIKGPYDLKNPGSLGGSVNAVSKQAPQGSAAKASLTYGSYDLINASATASRAAGKYSLLAGYAYKSSLPPKSADGKRITEIYPETSMNRYQPANLDRDAYTIDTFWIKGGMETGSSRTTLNYSYQDATDVLYPYLLMDAAYDTTHRINGMTSFDLSGPVLTGLEIQAWWNEVDHLMNDAFRVSSTPSIRVTEDFSMQTDSRTELYGFKLGLDLDLGPGQLETGLDYYLRNWDATNQIAMYNAYQPQPMLPDVDIENIGLYSIYTWEASPIVEISTGARLDFTDAEAKALDAERWEALYLHYFSEERNNATDFSEVSTNLQVTWKLSDNLELFTGIASAVRTPDPQELYIGLLRPMGKPNWVGNPGLDPTRNNQLDLGARLSGDGYYLNVSVFYSSLDDFIYVTTMTDQGADPLPDARSFVNIDAAMYGGELAGQIALPKDLFLTGALSYVRAENRDGGQELAEIPPLIGHLALRYDVGNYFVEITERFADRQDRVDKDLNESETPGWAVTDLKAGLELDRWSIIGGINNLFDKFYETHLSYQRDPFSAGLKVPETGTFGYLTVSYSY